MYGLRLADDHKTRGFASSERKDKQNNGKVTIQGGFWVTRNGIQLSEYIKVRTVDKPTGGEYKADMYDLMIQTHFQPPVQNLGITRALFHSV